MKILKQGKSMKIFSQINENFEKMPENKQSNLIANVKTPNIGFINKCTINSGIRVGGAIQC